MDRYTPGLHILATLNTSHPLLLTDVDSCRHFFDGLILSLGLTKVGEVYHGFPKAGFTAIVCLTESHVSIHTWPEHGLATFDVFLSNFENDNSQKARTFCRETAAFFSAEVVNVTEVLR
jgi:S-adenosylmethionine decarboxylase